MTRSPVPLAWVVASHRLLQNPGVPLFVIPAEAGIQGFRRLFNALDSRLRGNDGTR
ncbi:MAG: hypothetical protein K0R89_1053 [Ramlibacter sp.]|jgi:hypothetical protein|nr:hypothetical protein [Ramlibacter sp.]